jgi:hypothetical protein
MTDRNAKCSERVRDHFERRMADIRKLYFADCDGKGDAELGTLNEYGLSIDYVEPRTFKGQRKGHYRYQLSWGGPSEEFRLFRQKNGTVVVEFWLLDWFDGANVTVSGEDADIIEDIVRQKFGKLDFPARMED